MYDTSNTALVLQDHGDEPVLLHDVSNDVALTTVIHGGRVEPLIWGMGVDILESIGVIVPREIAAHIEAVNGGSLLMDVYRCTLEALPAHLPSGDLIATHVMTAFHGDDGRVVHRDAA
jgi:hypothetical protein